MTKSPQQIKNEVENTKETELALKFHEEHLYFNPKVEHDLNKVMKLRGVMKVNEVRKLLRSEKLSILTEYDKAIKEMIGGLLKGEIEDLICKYDEHDNFDSSYACGECLGKLNELLSKIGDNSEVEK